MRILGSLTYLLDNLQLPSILYPRDKQVVYQYHMLLSSSDSHDGFYISPLYKKTIKKGYRNAKNTTTRKKR